MIQTHYNLTNQFPADTVWRKDLETRVSLNFSTQEPHWHAKMGPPLKGLLLLSFSKELGENSETKHLSVSWRNIQVRNKKRAVLHHSFDYHHLRHTSRQSCIKATRTRTRLKISKQYWIQGWFQCCLRAKGKSPLEDEALIWERIINRRERAPQTQCH